MAMKKIEKYIIVIIALITVGAIGASVYFGFNNVKMINDNEINNKNKTGVKWQLIEFDITDNSQRVVKESEADIYDVIDLSEFHGNDLKIIEINNDGVKISRNVTKYKIINQTSLTEGKSIKYTEIVYDNVAYNSFISIDVDEHDPFGPAYGLARYSYKIKFLLQ